MFDAHMSDSSIAQGQSFRLKTPLGRHSARVRLFSRRYQVAWLLIIASGLVALFVTWAAAYRISELATSAKDYSYATIVIQKGDTLWDIAVQHGPTGWDPRKTVHHIAEVNRIAPESYAQLKPGDRIHVPTSRNIDSFDSDRQVIWASIENQP